MRAASLASRQKAPLDPLTSQPHVGGAVVYGLMQPQAHDATSLRPPMFDEQSNGGAGGGGDGGGGDGGGGNGGVSGGGGGGGQLGLSASDWPENRKLRPVVQHAVIE